MKTRTGAVLAVLIVILAAFGCLDVQEKGEYHPASTTGEVRMILNKPFGIADRTVDASKEQACDDGINEFIGIAEDMGFDIIATSIFVRMIK